MVQLPPSELLPKAPALIGKEVPAEKEYPKQVIVGLRTWSDVESAKKIITDSGGQIIKALKWPTKNVIIAVLPDKNAEQKILKNSFWGKLVGGAGFSDFGNKLSGGVDYVEEDVKVSEQGINSIDWGVIRIEANKVWNASITGKGVKVAVIDGGIQRDHPDLIANIKGGISFVPGFQWWDDNNGHGTGVAGIIAAVNNDIGYVGVAPEASLYAVKVGKSGSYNVSDIVSGIYWAADNGMQIANISLGAHYDPTVYFRVIAEETAAINYAYERGVVLVGATGNSIADEDCNKVMYPAAIANIIAVGSALPDNDISSFSCHGQEVDLAAPGFLNQTTGLNSSYAQKSGTSIAGPFVAGVAALILSRNPEFTPAQVRERLESAAVDLGAPGKDEYFGYGLVNAYDSIINLPPAIISLISPKGGEQWWQGTEQEVSWGVSNVPIGEKVDKVNILLIHQSGGATETISLALDAINNGKAIVNVPTELPVASITDSYFLQISCNKSFMGKCQSAQSGPLNITAVPPQALKILYPNGGERWPQGTIQSVAWTANYFGGPNLDITLMEKKPIPQYLLRSQSGSWDKEIINVDSKWVYNYGPNLDLYPKQSNFIPDYEWSIGRPYVEPLPKDTCDGNIGKELNDGIFVCPATSDGTFSCLDVAESKRLVEKLGEYWKRNVTCEYYGAITNVPVYSLISETHTCYIPSAYCWGTHNLAGFRFTDYLGRPMASSYHHPPDTCDGNIGVGVFSCPTTYSSDNLQCVDIWTKNSGYSNYLVESNVNCAYAQTGTRAVSVPPVFRDVPVKTLAENIVNKGSAEITVPNDMLGDNYSIQLSCFNFLGECAKGLSNASFGIIRLTDPVVLIINTSGVGAVTDGNIICNSSRGACLENYERGTEVTLYAASTDITAIFTGWSGACSGTETCQITMGSEQSVTATFSNRSVTLTAIPDLGTTFTGWSGACLSNEQCFVSWSDACATDAPCNITMSSDQSVIANFTKKPLDLNCAADTWTCSSWAPETCPTSGIQTRACIRDCPNSTSPSPATSQSCAYQLIPGQLREVNPSQ